MFVINPDPYSLPSYRIGPFRTIDLSNNQCLPDRDDIEEYFHSRFSGKRYFYTENGRQAINIALKQFNLKPDDVVSVFTTTNNFYISGCVTREIEKFCKWSRQMERDTKLILVNHEFGYPSKEIDRLKSYGLPIIEDCAHAFFSRDPLCEIGETGDFVVYSFPKMFPIQIGGLLVSKNHLRNSGQMLDEKRLRYIRNVLSHYIGSREEMINQRIFNYNYLKGRFESIGFSERFVIEDGTVPGVFMFKTEKIKIDLDQLKLYFYAHGVQCSVFYGEEAFFIPVHQALSTSDMDYFFEIMKSFIEEQS